MQGESTTAREYPWLEVYITFIYPYYPIDFSWFFATLSVVAAQYSASNHVGVYRIQAALPGAAFRTAAGTIYQLSYPNLQTSFSTITEEHAYEYSQ
jgi:hypothetical protein